MREPHVTPSVAVEPVVGLAQRYAMLTDEERPDAARLLYEHALAEDLPMPAGRGVPEAFAWIAQRLSRRRLLEDLGVTRREVEWLTLHVPPGGTGSLAYRIEREANRGGSLKVVGSGFGSGLTAALTTTTAHDARPTCLRIAQELDLRVRRYTDGSSAVETVVDAVGVGAEVSAPVDPCPLCATPTSALDPFDYEPAGPAIDLIAHDASLRQDFTYELEGHDEWDVGLSLDALGVEAVKASLTVRRRVRLSCEVGYVFPRGARFTPFRSVASRTTLPFWSVEHGLDQPPHP